MEHSLAKGIIFALGFLAQGFFSARIIVQWIISEREKRVVSPVLFWVFSIAGSYLFFVYGFLRNDFAIMLGQVISYYIYMWNLRIKGVWTTLAPDGSKVPNPLWKNVLQVILLITPVLGVGYILSDFSEFKRQCLQNDNIPILLVIYGSLGQIIFTLRFIYQFFYSKSRNESHLPAGFWIISLVGCAVIVSYAIIRKDPVLALGQSIGFVSYSRNLMLLAKHKKHQKQLQNEQKQGEPQQNSSDS